MPEFNHHEQPLWVMNHEPFRIYLQPFWAVMTHDSTIIYQFINLSIYDHLWNHHLPKLSVDISKLPVIYRNVVSRWWAFSEQRVRGLARGTGHLAAEAEGCAAGTYVEDDHPFKNRALIIKNRTFTNSTSKTMGHYHQQFWSQMVHLP